MVSDCNSIRELTDLPLVARLAARAGAPCFVDNDVNALAVGEWRYGVGRGLRSMVALAIGTDVGAGIIVDGALVRGAHGWAGEIGHASVNFDGPECPGCGGRGCLALYVGGRSLAEQARRRAAATPTELMARAGGDLAAITTEMVFGAAAGGDALATALVDEASDALAAALGAIVNVLNPELIVVTGGVARSLAALDKDIVRRVGRYAFARPLEQTRLCIVPGDKVLAVRGGAALARYEMERAAGAAERNRIEPTGGA
jgi:glucokinase